MTTLSSVEAMLSASLALKLHLNIAQQLQSEPCLVFDERLHPLDDQRFWRSTLIDCNVEEVFAFVSG